MSCDIDSDSFHVKKGGRRKTVSTRRAYVNTPIAIAKKLVRIADLIDAEKNMVAYSETMTLARTVIGRKITSTEYATWSKIR